MTSRVALVTGGTGGIGTAIVRKLAAMGHKVATNYRDKARATAWQEALKRDGVDVALAAGDVADPATAESMVREVVDQLGPVDILVNNAGITKDGLFVRMQDADWDSVLEVNLTAVFRLTRELTHPMMRRRFGRIINITSVVGASGNPGQANYCASKAGVAGMTRSLARELGSRNITVNCVAPGFIATDMTEVLPEAQKAALMAQIPLGRLGSPEDIAEAVAFLASPAAGYITGSELHVNGGMFMN